jgi:general stress protein YciG
MLRQFFRRNCTSEKGTRMNASGSDHLVPQATAHSKVSQQSRRLRERYGEDYYRSIGKKGGTALKEQRGGEYFRTIGQKGGRANVSMYGPEHFSIIGKKGGNITKARYGLDFYKQIGQRGQSTNHQRKRG